jgi:hypothetical protein
MPATLGHNTALRQSPKQRASEQERRHLNERVPSLVSTNCGRNAKKSESPASALAHGRYLILLELAVRRLERPHSKHAVGESHSVRAGGHPAAQ